MDKLPKFDRDSSYKHRGGSAKWLLLKCGVCKEELSLYQKDGPGNLLRLYLDRLTSTDGERPFKQVEIDRMQPLSCLACESVIGVPMVYEKDANPRPAIRLINSGVDKTLITTKNMAQITSIDPAVTMNAMIKDTQKD